MTLGPFIYSPFYIGKTILRMLAVTSEVVSEESQFDQNSRGHLFSLVTFSKAPTEHKNNLYFTSMLSPILNLHTFSLSTAFSQY